MGNCIQSPAQHVLEGVDKEAHGRTFHKEEDSIASTEPFKYMKNTCALEYWHPSRILGYGSISTVYLVSRRTQRVIVPYQEKEDVMTRVKNVIVKPTTMDSKEIYEELYALKSINQGRIGDNKLLKEMRNEFFTMCSLSHPNIVRVVEGYERKRHIYIIMEQCKGGDLYQVAGTTEQHAKAIVRNILSAFAYMHGKGVVHRDLKMENVMFATRAHKASEVKVIDFGLATKHLSNDDNQMTDKVGTLYTMAPEVIQGAYDDKCDMWSLGVVTYILLSASKPFWGPVIDIPWKERMAIMIDRIIRADYVELEGGNWENISYDAKEFVRSLLQLDTTRRPSAAEALNSQWMQTRNDTDVKTPSHMSADQGQQRARRLAVLLVVEKFTSADIVDLKRTLERYDPERSGSIAFTDLLKALSETGEVDPTEVDRIISGMNENKTQCDNDGKNETHRVFATLDELDTGNIGNMSLQKLCDHVYGKILSSGVDKQSCDSICSEWAHEFCNLRDDGEVKIKEVLSWFARKPIRRIESLRKMKDVSSSKILTKQLVTPASAFTSAGWIDAFVKQKQTFIYDEVSTS